MTGCLAQRIIISFLSRSQLQLQFSRIISQEFRKLYIPERCIFSIQNRFLCKSTTNVSNYTGNELHYKDYSFNYKVIIQNITKALEEILNLTNAEIHKILKANPQLKKRSKINLLNNHDNLLKANIQKSTITENIWLLTYESNILKKKLDCINQLKMNNDYLVPWLHLSQKELINYVYYTQNDVNCHNKIEYLVRRLECTISEMCKLTVRYPFLLRIPISVIDKKLDILHEYNVSNKNILKDLWVFRYTESHIRQRCELYKYGKDLKVKTWGLRCPFKIITKAIHKSNVKHSLMRYHKNVSEYIINKFDVDKHIVDMAVAKSPNILQMDLLKLNKMINLLKENGFTSNEIFQHGRILFFNITNIQNRIIILKDIDVRVRLPLLTCNMTTFKRYVINQRREWEVLKNYKNITHYLSNELNMDERIVNEKLKKHPQILKMKASKMNEMINILRHNGITNDHILNHLRIFNCKIETVYNRINTLKKVNLPLKMFVLSYSQKMFDNYLTQK